MTDRKRIHSMLNQALDRPLSPAEQLELDELLNLDSEAQHLALAYSELDDLLKTAPVVAPPMGFTNRVMDQLSAPALDSRPWIIRRWRGLTGGLVLVFVLSNVVFWGLLLGLAVLLSQTITPSILADIARTIVVMVNVWSVVAGGLLRTLSALYDWVLQTPILPAVMGTGFALALGAAQLYYQFNHNNRSV